MVELIVTPPSVPLVKLKELISAKGAILASPSVPESSILRLQSYELPVPLTESQR